MASASWVSCGSIEMLSSSKPSYPGFLRRAVSESLSRGGSSFISIREALPCSFPSSSKSSSVSVGRMPKSRARSVDTWSDSRHHDSPKSSCSRGLRVGSQSLQKRNAKSGSTCYAHHFFGGTGQDKAGGRLTLSISLTLKRPTWSAISSRDTSKVVPENIIDFGPHFLP